MLTRYRHFPFLTGSAAVLLLLGVAGGTFAQSQSDTAPSVAEAARRSRDAKKSAAKPVKTLTNDNLPAAPATAAAPAEGTTSAAAADASAAPASTALPKEAPSDAASKAEQEKQAKAKIKAELERVKKDLAVAEHELDVLERKVVLDSDAFYSKANYAADTAGKAVLDADAEQVNEKKISVEELRARIAELQAMAADAAPESNKNPQ